jgi:hypothetical protein
VPSLHFARAPAGTDDVVDGLLADPVEETGTGVMVIRHGPVERTLSPRALPGPTVRDPDVPFRRNGPDARNEESSLVHFTVAFRGILKLATRNVPASPLITMVPLDLRRAASASVPDEPDPEPDPDAPAPNEPESDDELVVVFDAQAARRKATPRASASSRSWRQRSGAELGRAPPPAPQGALRASTGRAYSESHRGCKVATSSAGT